MGTHVSGTVASQTYGVAKGATVVKIRVIGPNGTGPTSGVRLPPEVCLTFFKSNKPFYGTEAALDLVRLSYKKSTIYPATLVGTHVSGTVASQTYGVAKGATVVNIRVLGPNNVGPTSGVRFPPGVCVSSWK